MDYKKKAIKVGEQVIEFLKNKAIRDDYRYKELKEAMDRGSIPVENIIDNVCLYTLEGDAKERYFYLSKLLDYAKKRENTNSQEFFYTLEDRAKEIKQETKKMSSDEKEEYLRKKFTEEILEKTTTIIEDLKEKNYTKEELIALEQEKVTESNSYFTKYEKQSYKARGELFGCLNSGFYGKILKDVSKDIDEEFGKINAKNRYTEYMDKELLRYRIALLDVVKEYHENGDDLPARLGFAKRDMRRIGLVVREKFKEETGTTPDKALKTQIRKTLNEEIPKEEVTRIGVARKRKKNRQLEGQLEFKF